MAAEHFGSRGDVVAERAGQQEGGQKKLESAGTCMKESWGGWMVVFSLRTDLVPWSGKSLFAPLHYRSVLQIRA
jgi:hypothetical protein